MYRRGKIGFILIFSTFLIFQGNTFSTGRRKIEKNHPCKDFNHNALRFIRMGIGQTDRVL